MAFKFSWYWREYEANYFKPHGDAFLFALPPFVKTYLVTPDQRERLIGRLGRIRMFETCVSLIFVCVAFALIASVAYPDFDTSMPQFSLLGVLLVLALAQLAFVFISVAWRYFSVRGVLMGSRVPNEKFTRTDFLRNSVASMSKWRFKFAIAWRAFFSALMLYYVIQIFWIAGRPTEWIAHFEAGPSDLWVVFIVIALIVTTVSLRRLVQMLRLRRLAASPPEAA